MTTGRRFGLTALFLTLALFVGTQTLHAQGSYASIHGTVTDSSGAVVAGAHITVTNGSTGQTYTATTDGKGYYVLPQLPIGGPYSIHIDQSGFKSFQSIGLQLTVNENFDQDAKLQAGAVSQTVEVNASSIQVSTSDTQMQETFTANQIEQLPMLGRDASIVQKLTPGTVESSDRFGNYSANGSQTQENSYLLDGADINDAPLQTQGFIINPDALAEVTLLTSTQSPEYSRNSGAIINEQLKSGTNQFHGEGFEFYRDTFMNLGGYFAQPGERPAFQQNEYGGTLGGPALKNRLFFFLAYQGFHNASASAEDPVVPTDAQLGRNGSGYADLSGDTNNSSNTSGEPNSQAGLSSNLVPFQIVGPNGACGPGTSYTKWDTCFPTNPTGPTTVDLLTSNFNSISATLLKDFYPSPNTGNRYFWNSPNTEKEDQGVIRVDAQVTHRDLLWASSVFQSEPNYAGVCFTCGSLPGFGENNARHFKFFDASWTHTFTPTTLNELRAGYYRFDYAAVEPAQVVQPSSFGFAINPQDPSAAGLPSIGISGYSSIGFSTNGPQPRLDINESFSDNFTKIVGNHSFMLGAHTERFSVDNPFYARNSGAFGFGGTGEYSSGDPLLDFLVAVPDSYNQGTGALINAQAWETYAYAQDNWKISNSFTFNYGIGYDIQTPFANKQYGGEAVICFQPGEQSKIFPTAQPGLTYPGDAGCNSQGGASAKYDHFAPRVGFDWSPESGLGWLTGPTGEHLFALRAGFGLYFNRDSEEAQLQNLEDPPFGTSSEGVAAAGGSPSFADPFVDVKNSSLSVANPFPYTFPTPGQNINFAPLAPYVLSTISPNYDVPYAYNFNLNIQRQLPGNQLLQLAYVGSLGHKLVRAYEADKITDPGHVSAVATCDAENAANGTTDCPTTRELNVYYNPQDYTDTSGNFLSVGQVYTDGASNYNSMQASLENRTTHGLFYDIGYTWSHALDNGSSFESSGFGEGNDLTGTNWVPGFQHLSYGNSQFDARNRFFAAYEYVVPLTAGMRQNYIVNEALGGWHLSGYTVLQSGNPVSVGETDDNRSLYCNSDAYFFYECPDTPDTTNFHPAIMNPRAPNHQWFDTTPFSFEPLGTFGNVSRGLLAGPGFNYSDMTLFKDFAMGHADSPRYIEIRMEAFNVFNHPNFSSPDGNILDGLIANGGTFGQISSVVTPTADGGNGDPQPGRAVQLAAKIYF
ncbi:MAG TPA: carboxypeptidase-like regulatory domain-containing protein [Terracidiphilus sp.]|nr:carboxypeptidase-like regulatory domain-containing protein [Terracidiphilus sp.]